MRWYVLEIFKVYNDHILSKKKIIQPNVNKWENK